MPPPSSEPCSAASAVRCHFGTASAVRERPRREDAGARRLWHARRNAPIEVIIVPSTETTATGVPRRRLPAWVADVVLGIPVALGALAPDPFSEEPTGPAIWVALALGIAVAVALPLARRHPRAMLAATTVIAALAPLWSSATLGFMLAAAICLYRLASVTTARGVVLISFVASAALLVTSVVVAGPEDRYLAWMLQPIALLAGAAALGEATRSRRAYIDAITERAERAERTRELEAERRVTEERLRIARELHDAAGHQIAAINLHAGVAKNALPDDPDRAIEVLTGIQQAARAVLGEISTLLRLLRGHPVDAESGALAPVATWANVPAIVEGFRRTGLAVGGEVPADVAGLSGATYVVAYRVVQEGLTNAWKHGAGTASLDARVEGDELRLRIENPLGPAGEPAPSGRYGLIGIRERVESVRGAVTHGLESRPGETVFVLDVQLPLTEGTQHP